MSWLGAIKGFIGLSDSKGADRVFEAAKGIGNWIDEQQFTDQEKSEAKQQLIGKWTAWFDTTASENTERSIARRDLSLFIIRTEFMFLIMSAILYRIDLGWSKYIWDIATKSVWGDLTLGVGAFFFAVHIVRAAKGNE